MIYTDDIHATLQESLFECSLEAESPCPCTLKERYEAIFRHIVDETELLDEDIRDLLLDPKTTQSGSVTQEILDEIRYACSNCSIHYSIDSLFTDAYADAARMDANEIADRFLDFFHMALDAPSPQNIFSKILHETDTDYIKDANAFITYV